MPNIGATGEDTLLGMTKKNANEGLHITFIGIGVDFQTALIEEITKIRGANYYSVHSAAEFKKRMGAEFDYMVTPLVFNLNLKLDSTGYEIEKVYGSPEANESTGELLKVNTLFPSSTTEEGTKGGIVLLKLKKLSPDATLKLKVSYENRAGNTTVSESVVTLPNKTSDYFENNGIRKGVLLARYADLLKNWMIDERGVTNEPKTVVITIVNDVNGIPVPMDINYTLNKWEHQSVPLSVSSEYKTLFSQFKTYFETEASAIGDNTLSQEATLLDSLIKSN
jgi:Ca-activated chloride channel family protein